MGKICIFWFRRDLRLADNRGLFHALKKHSNVLPIFIFDKAILKSLEVYDSRVQFIHKVVSDLKDELGEKGSDLRVFHSDVLSAFKEIFSKTSISAVYCNHDFEPAAKKRDALIRDFVEKSGAEFISFKDQVIFEGAEVAKPDGGFYTVYTPYKNKWLSVLSPTEIKSYALPKGFFQVKKKSAMPTLSDLGFKAFDFSYPSDKIKTTLLKDYGKKRDFPALDATSHLGLHLRFGTISIRHVVSVAKKTNLVWLSELIWREFFMQILDFHPRVVTESFRPEFDKVEWRENKSDFSRWCEGQTGFPLVDAGMRELNATGYMHNRVRMVVGSFLTKHLLMHWYKGERYFAEKLLDYELSANNGNWQWVAGTGCDAAPYFRIFNPYTQQEKFDKNFEYVRKWVPEFESDKYVKPIVSHFDGRERALRAFAKAFKEKGSR